MPVLFFDFDDTLCDHTAFTQQYVNSLATVLTREYGGDRDFWFTRASQMLLSLETDYMARFVGAPLAGYRSWLPAIMRHAMALLVDGTDFPFPGNPVETAHRLREDALMQCNSLFPGVREMIYRLRANGIVLHLASGNDSAHLRSALIGSDLIECFQNLYGPDLVDCAKEGPEFYTRIFTASGVDPQDAIVFDNDPVAIEWARSAGADCVRINLVPDLPVSEGSSLSNAGVPAITEVRQVAEHLAPWMRY